MLHQSHSTLPQSLPLPPVTVELVHEQVLVCLEAVKAEDICTISLKGKSAVADYLVIATGHSARQLYAASNRIMHQLRAMGIKNLSVEGAELGEWLLLDAGDIIVHLFRPETRDRYRLEQIWDESFD